MTFERVILEYSALEACAASDYYDLLDCLSEVSDEELAKIAGLE